MRCVETAFFFKGDFKKTLENCPPFRVLKAFFFVGDEFSFGGEEFISFAHHSHPGAKRVALLDQPLCGFRRTRRRRTRKRARERERERERADTGTIGEEEEEEEEEEERI